MIDVTIVMVNYKTEKLTRTAIDSLRVHYPGERLILIDNHSEDESVAFVCAQSVVPHTAVLLNDVNAGHGPALHQGILLARTKYVFTLDSDTEVTKGGFLQKMIERMDADMNLYALGWLRFINHNGVAAIGDFDKSKYCPYVHPAMGMYRRETYLSLPPFIYDGAPAKLNMWEARRRGLAVSSFPIEQYVEHLVAGTRRMWGGRWNPRPNEEAGMWREERNYPI